MKYFLPVMCAGLCVVNTAFPSKSLSGLMAHPLRQTVDADWLVVGAGPAGIATLGVLLDVGISAKRITWIDPDFQVGRIGAYYSHVPANASTRPFISFVNACNAFRECESESIAFLNSLNPASFHELHIIINPLQDITNYLRTKVRSVQASMKELYFADNAWVVETNTDVQITAHNVVLATGSHPAELGYGTEKVIPLDLALNPFNLEKILKPEDVVGVVGSAHSGILMLKFLSELPTPPFPLHHIYNLYRTPLAYASSGGSGIRGATADWAQNVLEKNPPANITRVYSTPEVLKSVLEQCSKVIYAIGYQKNELPPINGNTSIDLDAEAGMIAPRLFGVGIAFPEKITFSNGEQDYCVGLDCFMDYAQRMIPEWVENEGCYTEDLLGSQTRKRCEAQRNVLEKSSNLFKIMVL